ncbi:hypothetical protein EDC04DRAFT_2788266 [Pisolithus marmoratus]|nr:hypothetical protein EDC04DRAFT_2788266 [Pisolithus marmoratus]
MTISTRNNTMALRSYAVVYLEIDTAMARPILLAQPWHETNPYISHRRPRFPDLQARASPVGVLVASTMDSDVPSSGPHPPFFFAHPSKYLPPLLPSLYPATSKSELLTALVNLAVTPVPPPWPILPLSPGTSEFQIRSPMIKGVGTAPLEGGVGSAH